MTRSKWLIVGAVAAIAAAIGWYYGSPAYTLSQMKSAAEANDSDKLASYIDFESLREDLKAEFMAHMMAESAKDDSGFAGLGMALGSAMVGPMIDGMVTPAGLRAAFIANRNKGKQQEKPALGGVELNDKPVIKRRGFSEFIVTSKEEPDSGMVFTRHGLGWKLSGVDMPAPK